MSNRAKENPTSEGVSSGPLAALARTFYVRLIRAIAAGFTNPSKLLRPEGATLGRLDTILSLSRRCPTNNKLLSLGELARSQGWWAAAKIAATPSAASMLMGLALFESFDLVRTQALWEGHRLPDWLHVAICGGLAGVAHGVVCAPLDLMAHRATQVTQQPGWPGLWRAVLGGRSAARSAYITLCRDAVGMSAYFSSFVWLNQLGQRSLHQMSQEIQPLDPRGKQLVSGLCIAVPALLAGGCAGCVYQLVSFPIDCVRIKQLKHPSLSMLESAATILQEFGWKGFVSNGWALKRSFAPSAVGLCAYEVFKGHMEELGLLLHTQLHSGWAHHVSKVQDS